MAKTIATVLGVVFLIVGVAGFLDGHLMGTHLSVAHNMVHILSGIIALYFGLAGTLAGARMFDIIFGVVYGLLGIAGFLLGSPGTFMGVTSNHLLTVIPGVLELGSRDHALHILLGIVFLIAGLATRVTTSTSTARA